MIDHNTPPTIDELIAEARERAGVNWYVEQDVFRPLLVQLADALEKLNGDCETWIWMNREISEKAAVVRAELAEVRSQLCSAQDDLAAVSRDLSEVEAERDRYKDAIDGILFQATAPDESWIRVILGDALRPAATTTCEHDW